MKNIEFDKDFVNEIKNYLKRNPTIEELAMFEVMHSEHCSYKSSKGYFKKLYTKNDNVLIGPGMDAGVVKVSDELAVVFKIESHNHPSYIDPYNGSATGVGGIIRDVLAMGADPIGVIDSLHFGIDENGKIPFYSSWLLKECVRGIADYGNSTGIPNLGGEIEFDESFLGNCLVNAGCIGLVKIKNLFDYSKVVPGDVIILVGNSTGRDGIRGVSFASKVIDSSQDMRPAVQIADPFTKKLIIDALREIFEKKLVKACRDLGGGGLTSATTEFCAKFSLGMEIHLDRVFLREELQPWEILISESQERMLLVASKENIDEIKKYLTKYELNFSIIGEIKQKEHGYKAYYRGNKLVDVDPKLLAEVPFIERHKTINKRQAKKLSVSEIPVSKNIEEIIYKLISHYNVCSRQRIFTQYDMSVKGNTLIWPEVGASVIELPGSENRIGVAITCQSNAFLCNLSPYHGTYQVFLECYRGLVSVFGKPLAFSDNLNFGSPENHEVMGDFSLVIDAMADSAKEFDVPCIGGNVSFYNENISLHKPIKPTPVIFMVGVIDSEALKRIQKRHEYANFIQTTSRLDNFDILLLITRKPIMTGSTYYQIYGLKELYEEDMSLNPVVEKMAKEFILSSNEILFVNDISRSGMIVNLLELLWSISSKVGCELYIDQVVQESEINKYELLFGTYYGYILIVRNEDIDKLRINFQKIKSIGKDGNDIGNELCLLHIGKLKANTIKIDGHELDLKKLNQLWLSSIDI
ncbi:MAG: phosphoribosylformylglycinamidine synthase subunit PurL [Candidatus Micrarchaeota archaeon]|nr:phosphoribosylformylglycinamidine synthase subunit PurL [Candidatus Micrarchaeota archaeon]